MSKTGEIETAGSGGQISSHIATFSRVCQPWSRWTVVSLDVTRQAVSKLLNGHAGLSAEMAIRFEKAFGVRADPTLRIQAAHDLAQARAHEADIKVERAIIGAT
jgi:hypothetical protein